jgi:predicted esterase YcpF (UPF0227 family)
MLLYLHGFRSSPLSTKARIVAARMEALGRSADLVCPALNVAPLAAIEQAEAAIEAARASGDDQLAIIGSSLGGFYATWLAERYGCRAAVLNPATQPHRDLAKYIGDQPLWHGGGSIRVEPAHIEELRALSVAKITQPERYYLLASTGDEVLDYREMLAHYADANIRLLQGSDHGIREFADYVDEVLAFCGIDV